MTSCILAVPTGAKTFVSLVFGAMNIAPRVSAEEVSYIRTNGAGAKRHVRSGKRASTAISLSSAALRAMSIRIEGSTQNKCRRF